MERTKAMGDKNKSNKKITLWECFGDVIVQNLRRNLTKKFKSEAIECVECGVLTIRKSNRTKYCKSCWQEKHKEIKRETWHKNKYKYKN